MLNATYSPEPAAAHTSVSTVDPTRRGVFDTIAVRLSGPLFGHRSVRGRLAHLERRILAANDARGVTRPSTRLPRPSNG